ncbi:hypothetical protein P3342_002543 [Pyrenophora teres f. teres]|nr:hypothetical protein P3342_002543 [Pyrenophora teres f. teres]
MSAKHNLHVAHQIPSHIPPECVIAALHDHSTALNLQALTCGHTKAHCTPAATLKDTYWYPPDQYPLSTYHVTECITWCPGIGSYGKKYITFPSSFQDTRYGIKTRADAAAGVTVRAEFRVIRGGDVGSEIEGEWCGRCRGKMEEAHREVCIKVVQMVEEKIALGWKGVDPVIFAEQDDRERHDSQDWERGKISNGMPRPVAYVGDPLGRRRQWEEGQIMGQAMLVCFSVSRGHVTSPGQGQGPVASYVPVALCSTFITKSNRQHVVALFPLRNAAAMMNSTRAFTRTTQNTFRKPLDFLSNLSRSAATQLPAQDRKRKDTYARKRNNSASSLDDTDHSDVEFYAQMETSRRGHSVQNSQSELQPAVPLIDVASRSNSPYPRNRSAAQSEDEDDDYEAASSIRPLVSHHVGKGSQAFRGFWQQGGPGAFFFGTWQGWQLWVGLLVFWVGGCSFGLLLMNRFIMQTGVYKFPFPLTQSYLQLAITHILLILVSSLLRFSSNPLHFIGFGAAVPPSQPAAPQGGAFRGSKKPGISAFAHWLSNGSGGIAGGGLFEFDWQVAKQLLPLAVVFVVKVLLSNFSFAYAPLPTYQLARIGITPLAIIFSCILQKENFNASTLLCPRRYPKPLLRLVPLKRPRHLGVGRRRRLLLHLRRSIPHSPSPYIPHYCRRPRAVGRCPHRIPDERRRDG